MSVVPHRQNQVSYGRYAGAALGGLYAGSGWHLAKAAYEHLLKHGERFPTRAEMHGWSGHKRTRSLGGWSESKRPRYQAGTRKAYIPRGVRLNYRTGGFENRPELKFYNTSNVGQTLPNNTQLAFGRVDIFTTPPQGTSASERLGRHFHIKSLQANFIVRPGYPAAVNEPQKTLIFTAYFVLDTQVNKALLTNPNLVLTDQANRPMIQLENSDRFRILQSKTIVIDPHITPDVPNLTAAYTFWSGNQERLLNLYKKVNIKVQCEPANVAAGAAATMNNGVYLIIHCNSSTTNNANTNVPKWDVETRVRYCC